MKHLTSIVAMDHSGAIGRGNDIPWRLKSDMRFFRQSTLGNTVIMGRKTFESLDMKPLPGRFNVILSHSTNLFVAQGQGTVAHGVEEGLVQAKKSSTNNKECFVVGGASIYEQFSPYVDTYLITVVDKSVTDADTFFNTQTLLSAEDWKMSGWKSVVGDGVSDEVNFTIFELHSKKMNEVGDQRNRVIDNYLREAREKLFKRAAPDRLRSREHSNAVGML